jgi:hypothetical protein
MTIEAENGAGTAPLRRGTVCSCSSESEQGEATGVWPGCSHAWLWRGRKIFSKAKQTGVQSRKNRAAWQAPLQLAPQRNEEPSSADEQQKEKPDRAWSDSARVRAK